MPPPRPAMLPKVAEEGSAEGEWLNALVDTLVQHATPSIQAALAASARESLADLVVPDVSCEGVASGCPVGMKPTTTVAWPCPGTCLLPPPPAPPPGRGGRPPIMRSAAEPAEQKLRAAGAAVLPGAAREEEVDHLRPDRAMATDSVQPRKSADSHETSDTVQEVLLYARSQSPAQKGRESVSGLPGLTDHTESMSPEEFQSVQDHLQRLEDNDRKTSRLEGWILLAICLNAVTIAFSFDIEEDWIGWLMIEACFTMIFVFELAYKVYLCGLCTFLRGPDSLWNISDTLLVFVSIMDNILWLVSLSSGLGFFTVFRLLRLARMIRGVRLLRHTMLTELSLMLDLIKAGIPTMTWVAMVLILLVFMLGLLMRQTLGRWCVGDEAEGKDSFCKGHLAKYGPELFSSVPLSCFTVFRCFTEGCASIDGTPLLAHVINSSWAGIAITCFYCMVYICVVFGIFNIVTGVLVEKTIASARLNKLLEDEERKQVCRKTAEKFRAYLKGFCKLSGEARSAPPVPLGSMWSVAHAKSDGQGGLDGPVQVTRQLFAKIVDLPQAQELLRGMSVMVTDGDDIFRLVDKEGLGVLDIDDFVDELPCLLRFLQRPEYLTAELQRRRRRARLSSRTSRDDRWQPLPAPNETHSSSHVAPEPL